MTNKEAIKTIKTAVAEVEWNYPMDYAIAFEMAACAIEKQIPKRVELYKHNGDFKWENYPCPYCGEMLGLEVNKRYVNFCPNCGQALKWNDSE